MINKRTSCQVKQAWLFQFAFLFSLVVFRGLGEEQNLIEEVEENEDVEDVEEILFEEVLFDKCDVDDYYADLMDTYGSQSGWNREGLNRLVTITQRNELPVVGEFLGSDDVYEAIIDLDRGTEENTVRLLYRDVNMKSTPHGSPFSWDIERLWPVERGTYRPSAAFSDIHHIRPADASVLQKKGLLSFGACNTVQYSNFCVSPATMETASDTAQDGKVWQPTARSRGDVARALMYVDLRYRAYEGSLQRSLSLRDCGPFDNSMGYLSQLLEWNARDPPDAAERQRNDRACSRWQGNRNPFVDFPELAEIIYGQPQSLLPGSKTYPSCLDIPTLSPTAEPNECSKLRAGDYPFFLLNSDDPDEVVIFSLNEIPAGVELFLTDNAWDGKSFVGTEGTKSMVVPDGGIEAGESFGIGPGIKYNDEWDEEPGEGDFSLNSGEDGDNLFLYCIDADNLPHFLSGILYTGGNWKEEGLAAEEYGVSSSALPTDLQDSGALYLTEHFDNNLYNAEREGGIGILRLSFVDPANWVGINDGRYEMSGRLTSSAASLKTTLSYLFSALISIMVSNFL